MYLHLFSVPQYESIRTKKLIATATIYEFWARNLVIRFLFIEEFWFYNLKQCIQKGKLYV